MSKWEAKWDGCYPNLCSGTWTLYSNGKKVDTKIPFTGRRGHAETKGEYDSWSFDDNWSEEWSSYTDGLPVDEWCEKYGFWLETIAPKEEWESIYSAFQAEDWRPGSCGGCI